jgi:flagellin
MLSIQTNIAALSAQNALTTTNNNLQKSMERLSSGFRINHAADDAAGLAISEKMQAQIGGLNQAVRNANDGASMIQTAEGALDQVQNMMVRMRNLAVQAASDTNGPQERADINVEIQQLKSEIDNISQRTTFNGLKLLTGSMVTQVDTINSNATAGAAVGTGAITSVSVAGAKAATTYTLSASTTANTLTLRDALTAGTGNTSTIDVSGGVNARSSVTLNFASLGVSLTVSNPTGTALSAADLETLAAKTIATAAAGVGQTARLQTGADAGLSNQTSVALLNTQLALATAGTSMATLNTAIGAYDTAAQLGTNPTGPSDDQATALITAIDAANDWISAQRASLGAAQNRLGYAAASLTTTSQNVSAANSQIRDVDVATETANMSKAQILMQAGVSVLAQANQVQQLALKLLNG